MRVLAKHEVAGSTPVYRSINRRSTWRRSRSRNWPTLGPRSPGANGRAATRTRSECPTTRCGAGRGPTLVSRHSGEHHLEGLGIGEPTRLESGRVREGTASSTLAPSALPVLSEKGSDGRSMSVGQVRLLLTAQSARSVTRVLCAVRVRHGAAPDVLRLLKSADRSRWKD